MYEYEATVISVTDGDTIRLDIDLGFNMVIKNTPIRLTGINAPEKNTPEGRVAKTYLKELLPPGTQLILHSQKDKTEKYGRILGILTYNNPEATTTTPPTTDTINNILISKGYATTYWPGQTPK